MSSPSTSIGAATDPWYRSLYWRIAAGLVVFLAVMLAAEGALFLWMNEKIAASMPTRSPRLFALMIAADVGTVVTANPSVDLQAHIRTQYGEVLQPFAVVMRDRRIISNQDELPDELLQLARREPPAGRGFGPGRGGPPPGEPSSADDARDRGPGQGRRGGFLGRVREFRRPPNSRVEMVPIIADGEPIGRVLVWLGSPSMSRLLVELGPTLGLMGGSVLVVGTGLIALFVFGPTRRRLKAVQDATTRLGGGDLSARAPERGGDEVAALGRSFNQMADELARRARALDASDTARRQLLADVSHELMTPLTAIRGYVETLAMSDRQFDLPTRERYLGIALDETHRLEHIIGDLLDLARLEGGGGPLRTEQVELAAVFERVCERHEREARDKQVTFVTQVQPGAEIVPGDPDRLEQALQNLAANALRHTPAGGQVTLAATPEPGAVRLIVRDTGAGIPADHLPLIFERFYKADAARASAGVGSGLGLSIVKAIVERHGGRITARNDNGAVFEMVLPRVLS